MCFEFDCLTCVNDCPASMIHNVYTILLQCFNDILVAQYTNIYILNHTENGLDDNLGERCRVGFRLPDLSGDVIPLVR